MPNPRLPPGQPIENVFTDIPDLSSPPEGTRTLPPLQSGSQAGTARNTRRRRHDASSPPVRRTAAPVRPGRPALHSHKSPVGASSRHRWAQRVWRLTVRQRAARAPGSRKQRSTSHQIEPRQAVLPPALPGTHPHSQRRHARPAVTVSAVAADALMSMHTVCSERPSVRIPHAPRVPTGRIPSTL